MKLVGLLMAYNEVERGNLHRCLDNLTQYCDAIAVYDDGSTDGTPEVCGDYGCHVIRGEGNNFMDETHHRQDMLALANAVGATHVFRLDADEVLDRPGIEGIRELCDGSAWDFECVTLWRSQTWRRLDYLGKGRFLRLHPVRENMRIPQKRGLHRQPFPDGLGIPKQAPYRVIHYGYATQEAIEHRWRQRNRCKVPTGTRRKGIDESRMELERVPPEWFPFDVPEDEPMPKPIRYAEDVMAEAGL